MKDARGIDPFIIQQLRQAAMAEKAAAQLLALWQSAAGPGGLNSAFMMLHFREAFAWGIAEMMALGAWHGFKDKAAAWPDEMIDARYAPLLEAWRQNPSPYPIPDEDAGLPRTQPRFQKPNLASAEIQSAIDLSQETLKKTLKRQMLS